MAVAAWILTLPWRNINIVSKEYGINPKIVGAIIMQESAGNHNASRYEPHFRWLLETKHFSRNLMITEQTEITQQKTSWGLMQIMGSVARELGFAGHLSELNDIDTNLEYGIKKLLSLKKRYKDNHNDILAAYNAGSPRRNKHGQYVNNYYVMAVNRYLKDL